MTDGDPETVVSASLQKIKSVNSLKTQLNIFIFFIKSETSDSFVNHFDGYFAYLKTLDFYFKACGGSDYSPAFLVHCSNFFISVFCFPGQLNFIFSNPLPELLLALGFANAGSCVGRRNKIGHISRRHRREPAWLSG